MRNGVEWRRKNKDEKKGAAHYILCLRWGVHTTGAAGMLKLLCSDNEVNAEGEMERQSLAGLGQERQGNGRQIALEVFCLPTEAEVVVEGGTE